jgi:hypothetical protein
MGLRMKDRSAQKGSSENLRTLEDCGKSVPNDSFEVTNEYPGGYWEDRGYNWFSGA